MNLILNTLLQINNTVNTDFKKDSLDDKIFMLRKEIRENRKSDKQKYNPNDVKDADNNIYYTHEQKGKRESHIRRILQNIFQKPFPSVKPSWLVNDKTRRKLEIDCFNSELRIAVEVQGEQHYNYLPFLHKNYENFLKQQERDLLKSKIIKERGIRLIQVPYNVETNDLEKFLMVELNKII